jgi:catechol 2,3-dioxygenase-like lactoylglutathione lyase family enzyme
VEKPDDHRPPVWTGHLALRSADPVGAARFYEQIGMRHVLVREDFAVLEMRGGTHLAIRRDPEQIAPGPTGWDLMVEDIDATHDKCQADGILVTDITEEPPHRSFEVTDADGHLLLARDSHVVGPV